MIWNTLYLSECNVSAGTLKFYLSAILYLTECNVMLYGSGRRREGHEVKGLHDWESVSRSCCQCRAPDGLLLPLLLCNNLSDRWLPRQLGFLLPHKWSVWHLCHFLRWPLLACTLPCVCKVKNWDQRSHSYPLRHSPPREDSHIKCMPENCKGSVVLCYTNWLIWHNEWISQ